MGKHLMIIAAVFANLAFVATPYYVAGDQNGGLGAQSVSPGKGSGSEDMLAASSQRSEVSGESKPQTQEKKNGIPAEKKEKKESGKSERSKGSTRANGGGGVRGGK